jgi:cytoskeletal protein CcmA (bactofilin family)
MAEHDAEFTTTIGQDATFEGKLRFEKGAKVIGSFEGEINSKGQLIIAGGGRLSGQAHAGSIRVEGQVQGNLEAGGKIQLTESARVEGDIQAAKLEVAEGAVLEGRCTVGVKPEDRAAAGAGAVKAAASMPADKVKPMRPESGGIPAGPHAAPVPVGR